jgi:hypothetical protein
MRQLNLETQLKTIMIMHFFVLHIDTFIEVESCILKALRFVQ